MTIVRLKILRGVGLMAADMNLVTYDSSDPYCQVFVGDRLILTTPVESQTLDPVWGGAKSTCDIDLKEMEQHNISWVTIKVYDRDVLKSDDPLGMVNFHPARVMMEIKANRPYPNVWRDLEPLNKCAVSGRLQFRLLRVPEKPKSANNKVKKMVRESALVTLRASPTLLKGTVQGNDLSEMVQSSHTPVTLHIYDVSNDARVQRFNAVTKLAAGGGIFHGAVEVHGVEYSFGGSKEHHTGIFACRPRKCPLHHYRESIFMGDCDLSPAQVRAIIERLKPEWMAPSYHLLRKNCCSFCKEFAIELGVGNIPSWIYKLADYGAAIDNYRSPTKPQEEKNEKEEHLQKNLSTDSKDKGVGSDSEGLEVMPEGSFEEGVEVSSIADTVVITPLDQIMVVRVQRAFRSSKLYNSSGTIELE